MKCGNIVDILSGLSPEKYACDWDNVGLLVGRKNHDIKKILVALDASKEVIDYGVKNKVDMLVTHHPMIFSSVKQVNEDNLTGEKILTLAENGICYYAMHTNFDAVGGMAQLAAGSDYMNLSDVTPIELCDNEDKEGMGRYGKLPSPMTARQVCAYVKEKFHLDFVLLYQEKNQCKRVFDRIAIMPGAGKSEMQMVHERGYDLYLTGDFGHHSGMDAIDMGMTIIDATHYGLEHIFIDYIASYLREHVTSEVKVLSVDTGCPIKVI